MKVLQRLLPIVFAWLGLGAASLRAAEPPNLLLILTDDHGYGDTSLYGSQEVRTPHLEQIAKEGMLFTRMRANCTVCSPTRAAILTGRYPDRVGVPGVIRTKPQDSWGYLDPKIPTLANRLKTAGYHTGIVGKWHLGLASPNTPTERGFDFFHGFLGDMMDSYTTHRREGHNYMRRNGETITPTGHATDLFSQWASDYIRERAKEQKPFFLYLAYNAPHFPIEPPAEWLERVRERLPQVSEKRAKAIAFAEHLDDRIGQVLAALKESGQEQNTLVIFTADNGGSLPHGQDNTPWKDGKQSHYDGGLRVPFAARWPAVVKAGTQSDYAGLTFDIFSTFLAAAQQPAPPETDGVNLLPILRGEAVPSQDRELYFVRREGGAQYGGKTYEALIRGDWKLLQNNPYAPLELYNLAKDPQETTDLATSNRKMVQELSTILRRHIQRGGATPWQPPTP